MSQVSPFIPGARVAIRNRYTDDYTEGFVEKVYKNGNFTLRGSPQQWRQWSPGRYETSWRAGETGDGYQKRSLTIWDASTDAEIMENLAASSRRKRWQTIRDRIGHTAPDDVTDAMLDQIEAALPKPKTQAA